MTKSYQTFTIWLLLLVLLQVLKTGNGQTTPVDSCTAGNTVCSNGCGDLCECKRSGCEFEGQSQNCYPGNQECDDSDFPLPNSCRRPNVFYSNGGKLCKSMHLEGACSIDEVIVAVNLFGGEVNNSRGIVHQPGNSYPPFQGAGWMLNWDLDQQWEGPVFGATIKDQPLFDNLLYGVSPSDPGKCISYIVPLVEDGSYDLTVRTMDGFYRTVGDRLFTIKFAGLEIFPEIDLISLANTRMCQAPYTALELAVNFEVSGAATLIDVFGFQQVILQNETLLEFCYSNCPNPDDNTFVVAAFSVVRHGNEMEEGDCHCWHNDVCQCKKHGCEFHSSNTMCTPAFHECLEAEEAFLATDNSIVTNPLPPPPKCYRDGALYSNGGGLCRNVNESIACKVEDTILAVNLGGGDLIDSRGIHYLAGSAVTPAYGGSKTKFISPNFVYGVKHEDKPLFQNLVTPTGTQSSQKCLGYAVMLVEDGYYELSVRTLDAFYHQPGRRSFNIRFAGETVFPEVDIVRLTSASPLESQYTAIDLAINFQFISNEIVISGYKNVPLDNGTTVLDFCYSDCPSIDTKFMVAAFAIVKLGDQITAVEPNCEIYDKDLCHCKEHGCEFDPVGNTCESLGDCAALNTTLVSSFENEVCYRPNVWYSKSGILCLDTTAPVDCVMNNVIAVNFGGPSVTGARGIVYQAGSTVAPVYGDDLISFDDPFTSIGAQPEDQPLYTNVMFGYLSNNATGKCVAYTVPLKNDGLYELAVHTLDGYYNQEGLRYFTIKFAGLDVFPEVDITKLAADPNTGVVTAYSTVELGVFFEVSHKTEMIEVSGFDTMKLENGETLLEFCFSDCPVENPSFVAAAFSVVIQDECTQPGNLCPSYTDFCSCKMGGCEFGISGGTCHQFFKDCGECTPEISNPVGTSCRRDGALYVTGGTVCKQVGDVGDCDIEETHYAVNFHGEAFTDSRGVTYREDAKGMYVDPKKTRRPTIINALYPKNTCPEQQPDVFITGFPFQDVPLFTDAISGKLGFKQNGYCVTYKVPSAIKDGKYELCFKTAEIFFDAPQGRFFTLMLGNTTILHEFDMTKFMPKCTAIDVIFPFEVTNGGNMLTLLGMSPLPITSKSLQFSLCNGDCSKKKLIDYQDTNYFGLAFYIARLAN